MATEPYRREVNRYVLHELIGSGGMSKVWRASPKEGGEDLAIKVIPIEDINPDFERRLRREPEIHQQLKHENIVTLHDWFREGDEFFIVMEYVSGRPLSALLKQSAPLSLERSREILRGVLRAVHHLHQNQVVHRDIKPGNILIGDDGRVKLTDFGIAKFGWQQGETRTQMGLGTPEYMSPEQVRGSGIDYRTDIWSLGIMLFEMLTGRKPFARAEETPAHYAEVIGKIMNAGLPDPRIYNPGVPDDAIAIIRKATTRDKDDRYQSAAEMLGALEVADPTRISPYQDPNATVVLGQHASESERMNDRNYDPNRSGVRSAAGLSPQTEQVATEVPYRPPVRGNEPEPERRSGSRGLFVVLFLLILAGAGYLGYRYWESQQLKNQGPLTKADALEISRSIAADYKRYSYDGNVDALASLYAPSQVSYFRKTNADQRYIENDYRSYFEKILATEQLDVEVRRIELVNDSSFNTQWIITYEREKIDHSILRGEATHDLTISRIDGEWVIVRERQRSIRRNDEAPPPVDTTSVDTTEIEVPEPEVDEPPQPASTDEIRKTIGSAMQALSEGRGLEAFAMLGAPELSSNVTNIGQILAAGDVSVGPLNIQNNRATARVTVKNGDEERKLTLTFVYVTLPELTFTSVALNE